MPAMGVARFDVRPNLRMFPVGNYLILYQEIEGGSLQNSPDSTEAGRRISLDRTPPTIAFVRARPETPITAFTPSIPIN